MKRCQKGKKAMPGKGERAGGRFFNHGDKNAAPKTEVRRTEKESLEEGLQTKGVHQEGNK